MFKRWISTVAKRLLAPFERRLLRQITFVHKTGPGTKAAQRLLFHTYRQMAHSGVLPPLNEAGFRNFSQFEEDGKLLLIFAALGIPVGTFVDVGAADGINSNCANLALNFGWHGVFIDGDDAAIERGRAFYANQADSWAFPPRFVHALVKRENINELLRDANVPRDVDFLSLDIDGNDYWVWDAIQEIEPKVVMVETHTEFGMRSIVVPYDKDYVYPGKHPDYHGASPVAMTRLAHRKGYRLVGANTYGFNLIYVRRGLAEDLLPEAAVEQVIAHPRNRERAVLFEPIKHWEYLEVE